MTKSNSIFSVSSKNVGSAWVIHMPRKNMFKVMSKTYFSGTQVTDWGNNRIKKSNWASEEGRFNTLQEATDVANEVVHQMNITRSETY